MLIRHHQQQVPTQIRKSSSRSAPSFCVLLVSAFVFTLTSLTNNNQVDANAKDGQASTISSTSGWTLGDDSWNYWWSYSGVSGPSYWGLLNLDWFICDKGRRQSPINIDTSALVYDAHLAPLRIVDNNLLISGILYNDGHSIVFNGSSALSRFMNFSAGAPADKGRQLLLAAAAAGNNENDIAGTYAAASAASKNLTQRSAVAELKRAIASTIQESDKNEGLYSVVDMFDGKDSNVDDDDNKQSSLQQVGRQHSIQMLMKATTGNSAAGDSDAINLLASGAARDGSVGGTGDRLVEAAPMLVNGDDVNQDDTLNGHSNGIGDALADEAEAEPEAEAEAAGASASETSSSQSVYFTGAGLAYSYKFEALNLRFGQHQQQQQFSSSASSPAQQRGSEHQINSRSFAGELQLLAYNWQLYKSYQEAATKPYGLLAIAILIDLVPSASTGGDKHRQHQAVAAAAAAAATTTTTEKHNSASASGDSAGKGKHLPNEQLERLLSQTNSVAFRGLYKPIENFNLTALLPNSDQFVTYEGSLTQPGCHESVTWLLLNRPLYATKQSFDRLRSISADEQTAPSFSGTLLAGNIRPVQAINNRPIRTNIRPVSRAGATNKPEATCPRLWTRYEYIQAK